MANNSSGNQAAFSSLQNDFTPSTVSYGNKVYIITLFTQIHQLIPNASERTVDVLKTGFMCLLEAGSQGCCRKGCSIGSTVVCLPWPCGQPRGRELGMPRGQGGIGSSEMGNATGQGQEPRALIQRVLGPGQKTAGTTLPCSHPTY